MASDANDFRLTSSRPSLRIARRSALVSGMLTLLSGCPASSVSAGRIDHIWGRRGNIKGRLLKPRAIAIDQNDRLYIVDMTARIQIFDRDGSYLHHWQTPAFENGKPSGLSLDKDNNLLVADTHYFRMLVYTPTGKLLEQKTIGGVPGHEPGQFGFATDAVQDSNRNYYIAEYGEYDRIQKFSPDGHFLFQWGGHGSQPGQFIRPQNLAIDADDRIWVADACNHRIQVFDATGSSAQLVQMWGTPGREPGQLTYPYDLVLDDRGHVYICEFGNHRVQKFSLDGQLHGTWGTHGRDEGQLYQPWSLARDSLGKIHVLDTNNHRVQRISM